MGSLFPHQRNRAKGKSKADHLGDLVACSLPLKQPATASRLRMNEGSPAGLSPLFPSGPSSLVPITPDFLSVPHPPPHPQLLRTAEDVAKMQEELEIMRPLLEEAARDTTLTMEQIKVRDAPGLPP